MQDWKRLGQHVVARRVDLGYRRRTDFAAARDLSVRILSDIENGRRANFDQATIAGLERALNWETGSAARVLEGGEPTIIEAAVHKSDLIIVDEDDRVARRTPDEIEMIYRSAGMTAQQKLEAIRMVLHLRAQAEKEAASANDVDGPQPPVRNGPTSS